MTDTTTNQRIASRRPLPTPADARAEFPLDGPVAATVEQARSAVTGILDGTDDRLLAVVGPCSTHDPAAALDYAKRLRALADELADELCVVMRVYLEKPRTTVGWKGLINDPYLDGSCTGEDGIRLARRLLLELGDIGMPAGCEFLDPIAPDYVTDIVSWAAIGARTAESQVHRQLASGLPMPVGFKNGTDGDVRVAVDALHAAAASHSLFGLAGDGSPSVVTTTGNRHGHLVLRGGRHGTNYSAAHVDAALDALHTAGLPGRLVIDASHGNSGKDAGRQPHVTADVAAQAAAGQSGIAGVMLESFLVDGRQELDAAGELVYGQSVTDACMGWETTVPVLQRLAAAVRARRQRGR